MEQITTVQYLESHLTSRGGLPPLYIGPDSDLPGLIRVVQGVQAPTNSTNLSVFWVGGHMSENTKGQLMDLFAAIGQHQSAFNYFRFLLPFQPGDLASVVKALQPTKNSVNIMSFSFDSVSEVSQEAGEQGMLDLLNEVFQWKNLDTLILQNLSFCLDDPALSKKIAKMLRKLELKTLMLLFKDPPTYNKNDKLFAERLEDSFSELYIGLESNYSLLSFTIEAKSTHLNTSLRKLKQKWVAHHLHLNKLGRKYVMSTPLNRDVWLEILPLHTKSVADIYYYLRQNTWMFTPEKDFVKEIMRLEAELGESQAELGVSRKRHREEMEAKDEEHREEMEAKDAEIKRLLEELETNQKRHKKETQLLKAQHKANHED